MARVHTVAKRRIGKRGAHALRCLTCGQPIEYGQPYKWFKMKQARGGIKKSYHPDCEIPMRDRTTSRLVTIWEAQAALDFSACESEEDCRAELEGLASVVRDVEAEYRESVENMEAGFGHRTVQADELEERAEALEGWADELEAWQASADREDYEAGVDGEQQYLDDLADEARSLGEECPV